MFEPEVNVWQRRGVLLAALGVAVATRLATLPKSIWEFDESLFIRAIGDYEPLLHHPPPPGYPLFIGLAKGVTALVGDPFLALVALSTVASIAGFVILASAFTRIIGDALFGIIGALLFYQSPAMLVHSTLPISDPGGLALLAASLYAATRTVDDGKRAKWPVLFAFAAAATVGWRPQLSIAILPMLGATLGLAKGGRRKLAVLAVFTVTCSAWLIPLAIETGGVSGLIRFETSQAGYLAEHDADVSRSGWSTQQIVLRFVAHPWGTKLLSFPIIAAAAVGLSGLVFSSARRRAAPAIAMGGVYLAAGLLIMDPADGVRYALASTLFVALLAAAGVQQLKGFAVANGVVEGFVGAAAVAYMAGSAFYVFPLLEQRAVEPSPPVAAAEFARTHFPRGAVALYELPLWPHATYLLPEFNPMRIDDGLARFSHRSDVPLFLYVDGRSTLPGASTFSWNQSDAYSKLTRNHYRVTSVVPLPPGRRFRPVRGVYAPERDRGSREWRWVAPEAEIVLPPTGATRARLTLGLPPESPIATNAVNLYVDGKRTGTAIVRRGAATTVEARISSTGSTIRLISRGSFVPAMQRGLNNRDPRRLAVQLHALEQLAGDSAAPRADSPAAAQGRAMP